ncbi:putative C-mannosyltransferase DPY19L3 isoform X2 [Apostichopus japonicus]|uniref:Putative C-mannosyltransferase DPY19L3 isoform X2 n=1 Tax=Stichopus japonicus TaxID=307972 RepID=A0A2G8L380_STIJA|nr:putative C-mannosyltransferase DPY19L3 isoform X2 [Apostichopus japonicus]
MRKRLSGAEEESFGSGDNKQTTSRGECQTLETVQNSRDGDSSPFQDGEPEVDTLSCYLGHVNFILGTVVMCLVGAVYAWYLYTLHENRLWFSNIMRLPVALFTFANTRSIRNSGFCFCPERRWREKYRSEQKQVFTIPTTKCWFSPIFLARLYIKLFLYYLPEALPYGDNMRLQLTSFRWYNLQHDTTTESWRTINVLNRFNIYQEVLLAAMYRNFPFISDYLSPIIFYIHFIFALHGIYLITLFGLGWLLGNSWLSGLLASAFYVCNRSHTTRVDFTVPLRESFAIPILYVQLFSVTLYLRSSAKEGREVESLLMSIAIILPLVAFMQFNNAMLKASVAQSFSLAACLQLHLLPDVSKGPGFFKNLFWNCHRLLHATGYFLFFYLITKYLIGTEDDGHIFRFLSSKFDYSNGSEFDVLLYMCNAAFQFMPWTTLEELNRGVVFLCYLPTMFGLLVITMVTTVHKIWTKVDDASAARQYFITSNPELCYHAMQSALFGVMAWVVMRMKYVWTPQVCVIAAFGVSCRSTWRVVLAKVGVESKWLVDIIRNSVVVIVLSLLVSRSLPTMSSELEILREFYDPDTVELMHWINQQTPQEASFSGSMQLLAGVKLCTGRKLTNHPHFEDKMLRNVTFQLYQVYAKRSVKEVYDIHSEIGTDFIILEDSICLARSNQGCRLIDIMDVTNGHPPDYTKEGRREEAGPGTIRERFCEVIRRQTPEQVQYFKRVFQNKTFRIYQVMSVTTTTQILAQ